MESGLKLKRSLSHSLCRTHSGACLARWRTFAPALGACLDPLPHPPMLAVRASIGCPWKAIPHTKYRHDARLPSQPSNNMPAPVLPCAHQLPCLPLLLCSLPSFFTLARPSAAHPNAAFEHVPAARKPAPNLNPSTAALGLINKPAPGHPCKGGLLHNITQGRPCCGDGSLQGCGGRVWSTYGTS